MGWLNNSNCTSKARSSYLPNEILWGHRFEPHVSYAKQQGVYAVDCSGINRVVQDNTPRISAAKIQMIRNRKVGSHYCVHYIILLCTVLCVQCQSSPATPGRDWAGYTAQQQGNTYSRHYIVASVWESRYNKRNVNHGH